MKEIRRDKNLPSIDDNDNDDDDDDASIVVIHCALSNGFLSVATVLLYAAMVAGAGAAAAAEGRKR